LLANDRVVALDHHRRSLVLLVLLVVTVLHYTPGKASDVPAGSEAVTEKLT